MRKRITGFLMLCLIAGTLTGCGKKEEPKPDTEAESKQQEDVSAESEEQNVTILIAAAASLENCLSEKLIPLFEEQHSEITVTGTYDSSGKLQTQIEEGADVDVFFSAAEKQMNSLDEEGLMVSESICPVLENKIVMIVPGLHSSNPTSFQDMLTMETVAIGDPESVPAGQYAKEAFESMGIWEEIQEKASLGTNVTEVLHWVEEASADAGIVYATDAASTKGVRVVAEAPKGSVSPVIYPAGIVKASTKQEAAAEFLEFLKSSEAMEIFKSYGFSQPEA